MTGMCVINDKPITTETLFSLHETLKDLKKGENCNLTIVITDKAFHISDNNIVKVTLGTTLSYFKTDENNREVKIVISINTNYNKWIDSINKGDTIVLECRFDSVIEKENTYWACFEY